jgi:hypothetical protein
MKIPEGWPTDVMIEVGANVISAAGRCDTWDKASDAAKRVYKAMNEHAPTPPAQDERFGVAAMIMRDVCELPQDDPEDPQTICINEDTLQRLIGEHLAPPAQNYEEQPDGTITPVDPSDSGIGVLTPPAQEAEPVAYIDKRGNFWSTDRVKAELEDGNLLDLKPLYTRAPSDKLRQAVEELIKAYEDGDETYLYNAVQDLRAELEGKS